MSEVTAINNIIGNEVLELKRNTKGQQNPAVDSSDFPIWYEFNDNGGAKFLEGVLARHLIETEKAFYCGGRYYFYENGVYTEKSNEEVCKIIKGHCWDAFLKKNHITNVFDEWKYDVNIDSEKINENPYILNMKNCLLDINTMEQIEHTDKLKSTIQFNANYNPHLNIKDAKIFNQYLDSCIKDEKTRLLAQEMLGYTYLGIYPEKFFILTGETNTGKSTFLELIEYIIGDKNKSNVPLQMLGERFDGVQLFNKMINICADLPQGALKDIGTIKMLTGGGDAIYAQRKGVDGFSFKNKAKLIFSCNQLPINEAEQSEAFYNRLILLSFPHRIKNDNIDPDFKKKLIGEIDYIFLWGLEGLKRLIHNQFRFTESSESSKLKEKYKKDSNPTKLFFDENCEFDETNTDVYIEVQTLYSTYSDWCKSLGYKAKDNTVLGTEIKKLFGDIKKQKRVDGKRKNVYVGLKYIECQ